MIVVVEWIDGSTKLFKAAEQVAFLYLLFFWFLFLLHWILELGDHFRCDLFQSGQLKFVFQ